MKKIEKINELLISIALLLLTIYCFSIAIDIREIKEEQEELKVDYKLYDTHYKDKIPEVGQIRFSKDQE